MHIVNCTYRTTCPQAGAHIPRVTAIWEKPLPPPSKYHIPFMTLGTYHVVERLPWDTEWIMLSALSKEETDAGWQVPVASESSSRRSHRPRRARCQQGMSSWDSKALGRQRKGSPWQNSLPHVSHHLLGFEWPLYPKTHPSLWALESTVAPPLPRAAGISWFARLSSLPDFSVCQEPCSVLWRPTVGLLISQLSGG